ncbi:MAG TPA: PKD domain-containing protein, partial [Thermoplasmata archaeon]
GSSVEHAFTNSSIFNVTLLVHDSVGHNASVVHVISTSHAFLANFTFAPLSPVDHEVITFNGTARGGTKPYTFVWDFGDRTSEEGDNVTHAFAKPGNFTVTLTVSDSAGHTFPSEVTIAVGPSIQIDFVYFPDRPLLGQPMLFVANATGGAPPYEFFWTFGDGRGGEGAQVEHTYGGFGFSATRNVTLTVCDTADRCTSISDSITLDSVFSIAVLAETGFAVLIAVVWMSGRPRRAPAPKPIPPEEPDEDEEEFALED